LTANGTVTCGGSSSVALSLTRTITIQSAVQFATTLSIQSGSVCAGGSFLVTLHLTNAGQAAALNLNVPTPPFAFSGPGGATVGAGPSPAMPVTLPGQTSMDFTWTLTGTTAGLVTLTTTVTGVDANSGVAYSIGPLSATELIATPGALVGTGTAPAFASSGQWFITTLTVTNTGSSAVTGISATALVGTGPLRVNPVAGPVP